MIAEILNNPTRYEQVTTAITINLRVCYDNSFRRRMLWNDTKAKQMLLEIVSYASHIFLHPSLQLEVHINLESICFLGKWLILENIFNLILRYGVESWKRRVEKGQSPNGGPPPHDDNCHGWYLCLLKSVTVKSLISDPAGMSPPTGIAYLGGACEKEKDIGIIEVSQHNPAVFYSSRTFVHEVSHQGNHKF